MPACEAVNLKQVQTQALANCQQLLIGLLASSRRGEAFPQTAKTWLYQ